jgi:hypothetical protein
MLRQYDSSKPVSRLTSQRAWILSSTAVRVSDSPATIFQSWIVERWHEDVDLYGRYFTTIAGERFYTLPSMNYCLSAPLRHSRFIGVLENSTYILILFLLVLRISYITLVLLVFCDWLYNQEDARTNEGEPNRLHEILVEHKWKSEER